jgi:N4-gp56 family major capsid protein
MTEVAIGSNLAVKLFSVALFQEQFRLGTFRKNLTGPAPKQAAAEAKAKGQTSPGMPFVRITDLAKGAGDEVTVDLFNVVMIRPTMGDRKLAGRLGHLSSNSMNIKINQMRGGVEAGGKMSQQRTVHNLRNIAKANLAGWNARAQDQLAMIHVAGARGYQDDGEWVIPVAADPEFAEITVNPVLPPTRNRRLFAGDATSVANLDTNDILTLTGLDRIRALIDDMPFPMQPVSLAGDPQGEENPLFVFYVSPRVWHQIQIATGERSWNKFISDARARASGWNHPLFMGEPGYWNGILIKKMKRSIRFPAGSTVVEYDASDVAQNVTAAVATDRCFLLGAQALGCAYGAMEQSGYHFSWNEETEDHKNIKEISTSSMMGQAKIRFTGSDGLPTDFGVMTVDCYAPAV